MGRVSHGIDHSQRAGLLIGELAHHSTYQGTLYMPLDRKGKVGWVFMGTSLGRQTAKGIWRPRKAPVQPLQSLKSCSSVTKTKDLSHFLVGISITVYSTGIRFPTPYFSLCLLSLKVLFTFGLNKCEQNPAFPEFSDWSIASWWVGSSLRLTFYLLSQGLTNTGLPECTAGDEFCRGIKKTQGWSIFCVWTLSTHLIC